MQVEPSQTPLDQHRIWDICQLENIRTYYSLFFLKNPSRPPIGESFVQLCSGLSSRENLLL